MLFILNEISIDSQFLDAREFNSCISELLEARCKNRVLLENFKINRNAINRKINSNLTVAEAFSKHGDRDRRKLFYVWFASSGPFHDDERVDVKNDYFEYAGIDVTDSGLGEAARRAVLGMQVVTFSFAGCVPDFTHTPLMIDHGPIEEWLGQYELDNIWTIDELTRKAEQARAAPQTWEELIKNASEDYPFLLLSESIYENPSLKREPFSKTIADSAHFLLHILNRYMEIANQHGYGAEGAKEILRNHFSGERARFSPESESNRNRFRNSLTF